VLSLKLRLTDFMDQSPVAGADVEAQVEVGAYWEVIVPNEDGKPEVELLDEDVQASPLVRSTSAADGRCSFEFDLKALFARQRALGTRHGKAPRVYATCRAIVTCAGLRSAVTEIITAPDGVVEKPLSLDFAKSIVGDTSTDTALLWFCRHGRIDPGEAYVCEIFELAGAAPSGTPVVRAGIRPTLATARSLKPAVIGAALRGALRRSKLVKTLPVNFDAGRAQTAVVSVEGLRPNTAYRYVLRLQREAAQPDPGGRGRSLSTGQFRTFAPNQTKIRLILGSCHTPFSGGNLNRWIALAERNDYDLALLVGDQIYEYGLEHLLRVKPGVATADDWYEAYVRRYTQYWVDRPMREVLRRTPTYMTWDDHEIMDDWGDVELASQNRVRFNGADRAYRVFQQAHNPGGRDGPRHYAFTTGKVAFFVSDSRGDRTPHGASYPVLGERQYVALDAWSRSADVLQADIVCFAAPVPFAWIPVWLIEELKEQLDEALTGAILGGVTFGPFGALVGGYIGFFVGAPDLGSPVEWLYKRLEGESFWPAVDLHGHWTFSRNQPDLRRVLDILFRIANDPEKKRLVFVLSGDVHNGGFHVIRSTDPAHINNPLIFQLTSSPISRDPPPQGLRQRLYESLVKHVPNNMSWGQMVFTGFPDNPANFKLVGPYSALMVLHVGERNYGRLDVHRQPGDRRLYRCTSVIAAETETMSIDFNVDLDDQYVTPEDTSSGPTLTPLHQREHRA
jgi:hypothetical protein